MITFAFALTGVWAVSAISPNYCWDFQNAGSSISNTCSLTTSNLIQQGISLVT